MSKNTNNGLITKIWGPPLWTALHSICFGYPLNPTTEQKEHYKRFFIELGHVLPCRYCRDSYQKFSKDDCTCKFNENVLENRKSLTRWSYNLHNRVNNKLGIDYGITYEEFVKKYESYRAKCSKSKKAKGCLMPLNKKKECYKEANKKDCPIISYDMGKKFYKLAKLRGIKEKNFYFWNMIKKNNGKIVKDEIWDRRNKYCGKIISYMREHGIKIN